MSFLKSSTPGFFREGAVSVARQASNLEVLGRGLAAIGNLFVFHGLSFVERGKTGFLDRRNMHKNVLATRVGLDEPEALGRVEPLHSTFSHYVVSAGSKNKNGLPVPANRHVRWGAGYALCGTLDSLNDRRISAENDQYRGAFAAFGGFPTILRVKSSKKRRSLQF